MKRFAWGKGLILAMVTTMALAGCSKATQPEKAPEDVVKEAMESISGAKSMQMLMAASVDVKAIDAEKIGFEKAHFEGNFDVGFDVNDMKTPKISLKIDAKGSENADKEESAAGEMRIVGNTLYASLAQMSDFKGSVPMALVQPYFGKWWSVEIPADFLKGLEMYSKEEKDLTDEEKKLKDLYAAKNLFKNVKFDGNEEVDGVDTFVYSAELDKEEAQNLIIEMAKAQGQPLSEEEIKQVKESWSTLTLSSKVYVGQKDMKLKRLFVDAKIKDLEGADVDAGLTFTYKSVGEAVSVEVPADATPFDLGAMFGGFGATALPTEEVSVE